MLDSAKAQLGGAGEAAPEGGDDEFDAACICVSVDYLVKPVQVIRDIGRVVTPGGPLVITFSNRCFPTKAVAIWHHLSGQGQQQLVESYLTEAGNWEQVRSVTPSPMAPAETPSTPSWETVRRNPPVERKNWTAPTGKPRLSSAE